MLLHMDGFDSYENSSDLLMEYTRAQMYINYGPGRWGTNALSPQNYAGGLEWTSNKNLTEIWAGMALLSGSTNNYNLSFFSIGPVIPFNLITSDPGSNNIEIDFTFNPTTCVWSVFRGIEIYSGSTQMIGSTMYPILQGIYHWIDLHYIMSPTSYGIVEIWVDGQQILNITGSNTTQFGSTTFNTVNFGGDLSNPCLQGYIDDIYVLDTTGTYNNTRLGDTRIDATVPSADGSVNNGTPYQQGGLPFSGPNYLMVNEPFWSNYNVVTLTNTVGQEELYYMTDLPDAPENIQAIRVLAVANASDSNSNVIANTTVISGGVEADGNSTQLKTTYSHVSNIFETNPSTLLPWADFNIYGTQCGFKIT